MLRHIIRAGVVSIFGLACVNGTSFAQTTLSQTYSGEDRSGQLFKADVCYHSSFHQMQLANAQFEFATVMRFCNFSESHAQGARFDAFLYNQEFKDSHLEGSTFHLKNHPDSALIPSQARFIRTHLNGAKFYGNVEGLKFEDTSLLGVTVNDRPCEEVLPDCQGNLMSQLP